MLILYAMIFLSIAAILGLVLVVLQKKGIVKPVMNDTAFMSGGMITLAAVAAGVLVLYNTSMAGAILYAGIFAVAYGIIQYIFRK